MAVLNYTHLHQGIRELESCVFSFEALVEHLPDNVTEWHLLSQLTTSLRRDYDYLIAQILEIPVSGTSQADGVGKPISVADAAAAPLDRCTS